MANESHIQKRDWRNWSVRDWNCLLFDHFFRDLGDHNPVSRIAINNDLLRRIVGEVESFEVYEAFRSAVCQDLGSSNLARVIDSIGSRTQFDQECPDEFVYLAVTCYVATHAAETWHQGNFRRRLKEFLRQDTADQNYWLNHLPKAWKRLQRWLDRAVEDGRPFRRLVLRPPPANLRIIGDSLSLAFPSHRDHLRLVESLSGHGFSPSPPVVRVMEILSRRLRRFSDRFQHEFWLFRNAFEARRHDLHEFPFWSAVREAVLIREESQKCASADFPVRVLLRLDREEDWRFGLSVFLNRQPPSGMTVVPARDHAVGEFQWVLSDAKGASTTPAEWIIDGHAHDSLFRSAPTVRHVLDGGVLLFEPNEDDVWVLKLSLPKGDRIRALIRRDVNERIGGTLASCGALPRNSRYANWFEVEELSRARIETADLANLLHDVDVLQPTVDDPTLHMRGGVRTDSGWLGWRACLPTISTLGGSVEVTAAIPPTHDEVACIELEDSGTFAFPDPPLLAQDLDGECIIRARREGAVVSSKRVRFESRSLSCVFREISDASSWLCEGGTVDVGVVSPELRVPDETAEASLSPEDLISGPDRTGDTYCNDIRVAGLTEVLAGRSLRRGLLNASEVVKWFHEILQLGHRNEVWTIIRSWIEAGALDQFIHRNWRCTSYRSRRPRFVVTKASGNLPIRGVLQGLTPFAIEEAIRRAAEGAGGVIEQYSPIRSCLPAPLVLFAADVDAVAAISNTALISEPEFLRPVGHCVCSSQEIEYYQPDLRRNHVPNGEWDWGGSFFTTSEHTAEHAVKRFRREDTPDSYIISSDDLKSIHTFSKTWALLIGAEAHAQGIFAADQGSSSILMRPGLHLPLPVGRWATATAGVCPGATDQGEYEYRFTSTAARDEVLKALWKPKLSENLRRRIERVDRICRAERLRHSLVAVPSWVIEVLKRHESEFECQQLIRSQRITRRLVPELLGVTNAIRRSSHGQGSRG